MPLYKKRQISKCISSICLLINFVLRLKMWKLFLFCLFVTNILKGCHATANATNCKEKEKSLANLDIAKDAISKAKLLLPSCAKNCSSTINSTSCEAKEKSAAYLDIAVDLISVAANNYPNCNDSAIVDRNITEIVKHNKPMDCAEVLENGRNVSGIYNIWPRLANKSIEVYCDMNTVGGGWTVIQRRGNFSKQENFYQNWETYKKGFGNNTQDFWIGNDNIFFLSNQKNHTLRFDLESTDRETSYAEYHHFRIEDEKAGYIIRYKTYNGTAGDSMTSYSKDRMFSTKDRHNDAPEHKCGEGRWAGWWYWNCSECNPNGLYQPGVKDDTKSVTWKMWKNYDCLLSVEMKLRPL